MALRRAGACGYCHRLLTADEVTLDRKDNSRGYTPDNVVPACRRCNVIKGEVLTYEQMTKVAAFISTL